jgi:hypothetical protein
MTPDRNRVASDQAEAQRVLERNKEALTAARRATEEYRAVYKQSNEGIPRAQRTLRRAGYLK